MLLRISSSRSPLPRLPQIYLYRQTRSYKNQHFRNPEVFNQTIVLTDGSTFKIMSSSPRATYRLTRDKCNHPLWTGRRRSAEEDEQNQQLAKFRRSFSGALGSEESMNALLHVSRRKGAGTGDEKLDAMDALFEMMESENAYKPTKGREIGAPKPTGRRRGVRT